MSEEGGDFFSAHVFGVAGETLFRFVEEDIALDLFFVGLFAAVGVVFGADGIGELDEEFAGKVLFHEILTFRRGGYNMFIG